MILMDEAERRLRAHIRNGEADAAVALLFQFMEQRRDAMHLRAQAAESRANKAERNLDRIVASLRNSQAEGQP